MCSQARRGTGCWAEFCGPGPAWRGSSEDVVRFPLVFRITGLREVRPVLCRVAAGSGRHCATSLSDEILTRDENVGTWRSHPSLPGMTSHRPRTFPSAEKAARGRAGPAPATLDGSPLGTRVPMRLWRECSGVSLNIGTLGIRGGAHAQTDGDARSRNNNIGVGTAGSLVSMEVFWSRAPDSGSDTTCAFWPRALVLGGAGVLCGACMLLCRIRWERAIPAARRRKSLPLRSSFRFRRPGA